MNLPTQFVTAEKNEAQAIICNIDINKHTETVKQIKYSCVY